MKNQILTNVYRWKICFNVRNQKKKHTHTHNNFRWLLPACETLGPKKSMVRDEDSDQYQLGLGGTDIQRSTPWQACKGSSSLCNFPPTQVLSSVSLPNHPTVPSSPASSSGPLISASPTSSLSASRAPLVARSSCSLWWCFELMIWSYCLGLRRLLLMMMVLVHSSTCCSGVIGSDIQPHREERVHRSDLLIGFSFVILAILF